MLLFLAENVFMYEQPPPYGGIGPNRTPYQFNSQPNCNSSYSSLPSNPPQLPFYNQATTCTTKSKFD